MGISRKRVEAAIRAALSGRQKGWYLSKVGQLQDGQLAAMALVDGDDDEMIVGYLQGELGQGTVSGGDAAAGAPSRSGQAGAGGGAGAAEKLHIQQAQAGARFVAHFGGGLSCATSIASGWLVSYAHGDHALWQLDDKVDVWFKANPAPSSVEELTQARAVVKYISNQAESDFVLLKLEDIQQMPAVPIISASLYTGGQYIMVGASARSQELPFSVRHGVILSTYIDEHNHVKGDTPSFAGDSGGACFWVSDGSLFAINLGSSEGACALLPVSLPLAAIRDLGRAPHSGSRGVLASGASS